MPKIKIIILCLCLFLPIGFPIGTNAIFLSPGHFEPAEPLSSGRPYVVNFFVSNNEDKEVELIPSLECFQEMNCAPADWFKVFPESFKLQPKENKKIEVIISIPKNQPDEFYQNVLMVSGNPAGNQGTNLSLSLGGIIRFEKRGDLNWLQRLYFSFRQRLGNTSASVGKYALGNILLYFFAGIGAILLLLKLIGFIAKRFR